MAAYAALVSPMNDLELIPKHPTHSFSFDNEQITSLSQAVNFLVGFLESYGSHGCTRDWRAESQLRLMRHTMGSSPTSLIKFMPEQLLVEKQDVISCWMYRKQLKTWNLQMLTVHNLGVQITVPYEIWEMSQLRHVEFLRVYLPHPLPNEESHNEECIVMQNLHTLLGVEDLRLTEEVCKRMPKLKELSLLYGVLAGDREDSSHYCPQNLDRFNKLESLICDFGVNSNGRDIFLSFTFPTSLQEVSLWNSCIFCDDLTMMIKYLPHLGSLNLGEVRGPEWELVGMVFPCLKELSISRCDDLMCWNASSSHFPVLESLDVWYVPKLIEVPFDIGDIPTLRLIRLGRCSTSAAVSALRILAEQESFGNHDLRLEVDVEDMEEVKRFQEMAEEECLSNNLHLSYQHNMMKAF